MGTREKNALRNSVHSGIGTVPDFELRISDFIFHYVAVNHAGAPIEKDLVLLGGGHSHVAVLKSFGMRPMPGVRVTLVSRGSVTPYSGMLPGLIAGHYTFDQAHIELRPLCRFAGTDFVREAVSGLDLANRRVLFADRAPLGFDVLSLDVGSVPNTRGVPGAAKHALPVKPIDRFLARWEALLEPARQPRAGTFRVVVVGGGAGGVELLLAARHRLMESGAERESGRFEFYLVTATATILPTHSHSVRQRYTRILAGRGVAVHTDQQVVEVTAGEVICESGLRVPHDVLLWTTQAAAAEWFRDAGLATDAEGFVAVNDCLQSLSHPFVFATGDCAVVINHPRPKSGVFAVRQGRPLAENLRRVLNAQPLESFRPQREFLSLISTGDKYAVASRGPFAAEGAWVWRWKDWIDRRWMRRYQELSEMGAVAAEVTRRNEPAGGWPKPGLQARCGGCGAKVGSDVLHRVLKRLEPVRRNDVVLGLDAPDDAAAITVPPGMVSVQTVDFFRAFISDPFLFGRIAANHCLNDLFAMGAEPQSALAIAVLPFAAEAKMEEQLFQVMAGAVATLNAHNVALIGGHSSEGAESGFGVTVNGVAEPSRLLRKGGLKPGDQLILSKPLGTGALFAAEMRGEAKGAWIDAALDSMLRSNAEAARIFVAHCATACTDVSGFGLAGHLLEVAKASGVVVELNLPSIPLLVGAREVVAAGIASSLQPQNFHSRRAMEYTDAQSALSEFQLLFDPQTAGGLLTGVAAEKAAACVAALRLSGSSEAIVIGEVRNAVDGRELIRLCG
jgi:selenide,water dikinase